MKGQRDSLGLKRIERFEKDSPLILPFLVQFLTLITVACVTSTRLFHFFAVKADAERPGAPKKKRRTLRKSRGNHIFTCLPLDTRSQSDSLRCVGMRELEWD